MRPLTPALVPSKTVKYIQHKHEEHITRQDLLDVIYRNPKDLTIRAAARRHRADYLITGQSHSGKNLFLCVIVEPKKIKRIISEFNLDINHDDFASLIYNAWEV